MDSGPTVKAQMFRGEISALHWKKNGLHTLEWVRGTFPTSQVSPKQHRLEKEKAGDFSWGKSESSESVPDLIICAEHF